MCQGIHSVLMPCQICDAVRTLASMSNSPFVHNVSGSHMMYSRPHCRIECDRKLPHACPPHIACTSLLRLIQYFITLRSLASQPQEASVLLYLAMALVFTTCTGAVKSQKPIWQCYLAYIVDALRREIVMGQECIARLSKGGPSYETRTFGVLNNSYTLFAYENNHWYFVNGLGQAEKLLQHVCLLGQSSWTLRLADPDLVSL